MIRMFVRHTVADFDTWKAAYDAFEPHRKAAGVHDHAVFCGAESAEEVTIWHDLDDLASARALLESDELRGAMEAAGVTGEPQVWFCRRDLP